jgi:hypothetical protein
MRALSNSRKGAFVLDWRKLADADVLLWSARTLNVLATRILRKSDLTASASEQYM